MVLRTKTIFGSNMESEKEAFDNVMNFLKTVDVKLRNVMLNRYHNELICFTI